MRGVGAWGSLCPAGAVRPPPTTGRPYDDGGDGRVECTRPPPRRWGGGAGQLDFQTSANAPPDIEPGSARVVEPLLLTMVIELGE